ALFRKCNGNANAAKILRPPWIHAANTRRSNVLPVDDLSWVRRRGERMLTPQSDEVDVPVGIALRQTLAGHKGIIYDVVWSPDGTMLASGSEDRIIRICDTSDWRLTGVLEGHSHWVRSISWMPTTDIPEHALPPLGRKCKVR